MRTMPCSVLERAAFGPRRRHALRETRALLTHLEKLHADEPRGGVHSVMRMMIGAPDGEDEDGDVVAETLPEEDERKKDTEKMLRSVDRTVNLKVLNRWKFTPHSILDIAYDIAQVFYENLNLAPSEPEHKEEEGKEKVPYEDKMHWIARCLKLLEDLDDSELELEIEMEDPRDNWTKKFKREDVLKSLKIHGVLYACNQASKRVSDTVLQAKKPWNHRGEMFGEFLKTSLLVDRYFVTQPVAFHALTPEAKQVHRAFVEYLSRPNILEILLTICAEQKSDFLENIDSDRFLSFAMKYTFEDVFDQPEKEPKCQLPGVQLGLNHNYTLRHKHPFEGGFTRLTDVKYDTAREQFMQKFLAGFIQLFDKHQKAIRDKMPREPRNGASAAEKREHEKGKKIIEDLVDARTLFKRVIEFRSRYKNTNYVEEIKELQVEVKNMTHEKVRPLVDLALFELYPGSLRENTDTVDSEKEKYYFTIPDRDGRYYIDYNTLDVAGQQKRNDITLFYVALSMFNFILNMLRWVSTYKSGTSFTETEMAEQFIVFCFENYEKLGDNEEARLGKISEQVDKYAAFVARCCGCKRRNFFFRHFDTMEWIFRVYTMRDNLYGIKRGTNAEKPGWLSELTKIRFLAAERSKVAAKVSRTPQ